MIQISSKTAAAELRRFERRQAALKGRLSRLIDAYADFAAEDLESIPEAPQRRLMRDLLAITRADFDADDHIAGDGLIGEAFEHVSYEEEYENEIACQQ